MPRRWTPALLVLIGALVLSLAAAIALGLSTAAFERFTLDRVDDTGALAGQAAPTLVRHEDAAATREAMSARQRANGGAILLLDTRGTVVDSVPAGLTGLDPRWHGEVERALAGARTGVPPDNSGVFDAEPLVVVEPVRWGAAVFGAVVTVSPTTALRDQARVRLALLTCGALALLACVLVSGRLLRRGLAWQIRRLDVAAAAIAAGRLRTRAPVDAGPPEIRRLGRAVNTMADRLTALSQAQRNFVADAAHQMRNPLTALRLRVENLEPFVDPAGRGELDRAIVAARRFAGLVNALLSLARTEAREIHPVRMDAHAVAGERVDLWSPAARRLGVRLTLTGPPAPASCAPDVLDQVLDVLLDNALHIAPVGSTVRIRTEVGETGVAVHVADQGPGMSAADKERACERFWRGGGQGDRSGSGLGLAIASTLMGSVGGTLTFEDVTPRGLDVVVGLQSWDDPAVGGGRARRRGGRGTDLPDS